MNHITRNSAADIHRLATQPGGMPQVATMQPKLKFTVTKANYFAGLPFLNGISKNKTYKSNGDKEKIQKDWRQFDLPPSKLSPQCETHLLGMMVRASHRNQSLLPGPTGDSRIPEGMTPSQMPKVIAKTLERIGRLEFEERKFLAELATLENGGQGSVTSTSAEAKAKLAKVRKNLQSKTALIDAAKQDAHDNAITQVRERANAALDALKAAPGDQACKVAYTQARERLIESATQKFFDAYCTLREHEGDQARATGMQTMLPQLARQLQIPAKYVLGMAAFKEAEALLDNVPLTPAERDDSLAVIRDQLVGRRARDLTAGRTSELPGPPPTKEEAAAWSDQATQLKTLAEHFGEVVQLLDHTMPELKTQAENAQTNYLNDLIEHLPSYGAMTATQCTDTAAALRTLKDKLAANDVLQKDAPLPGMQLMHVVSMAESVTGHDPERSIALYQTLASDEVHDIIVKALRNVQGGAQGGAQQGVPLDRATSDLIKLWEMSAHVVPETVGSLLACNPANQVDWRDVQSFFRCSKEFARLADLPATESNTRHKDKMNGAMAALRDELTNKLKPPVGSTERRDWAMVKSAVWAQPNVQHVEQTFADLHTTLALPGTTVEQMHDQFEKKLRGSVKAEARAEFRDTLGDLRDFAKTRLGNAEDMTEKKQAALLQATSEYIGAHRGTEKVLTKASRYLTWKEGTFNAGTEFWSNPLKAKEKKIIAERAAELAGLPKGTALTPPDLQHHPALSSTGTGSSAIDLLREGLRAVPRMERHDTDGAFEDSLLKRIATLDDKVKLAEGGKPDGPEAIRRLLHDAIDRTELGDRSDTINARQFKLQVPFGGPVAPGTTLYTTVGASHSSGMIVNVQANNDCVQLTMGRLQEIGASVALALGVSGDALPDRDKAKIDKTPLSVNLPGAAVKYEQKQRTDPAVVLKISIEPEKGLRDLGEARGALKQAVDLLIDFKPNVSCDGAGTVYASAYEMLCDQLDAPFTIDDEVRKTASISAEATVSGGRVAFKLPNKEDDHVRLGLGATTRIVRNIDIMESTNQQGAKEKYDTRKNTWKLDAFLGLNTPKTTIQESDGQGGSKPKFTFPIIAGLGGGIDINIGGSEVKDKFPVGTDKFVAFKKEYGNYSRDMQHAIHVMLESLPAVANRVQEVVDKGFRALLEDQLADAARARGPKGEPTQEQRQLRGQLAVLQADIDRLHSTVDGLQDRITLQEHELVQEQKALPIIFREFLGADASPVREQLGIVLDNQHVLLQQKRDELGNQRALLQQSRSELDLKQTQHANCATQLLDLDARVALGQVVDKELAKMEADVLMNFGRALMLQRTDRFSVKLESKQQWAHRGIDAAIEIALQDDNQGLAQVMGQVAAKVFENDKDQAVKYLIAAGDLSVKQTSFDIKTPLRSKRLEVKGMTEDPVPDTRTATLNPTAQRLIGVRISKILLSELQDEIIKKSLETVTTPPQGQTATVS